MIKASVQKIVCVLALFLFVGSAVLCAEVQYTNASRLGMIPDDERCAAFNYKMLKKALSEKKDIFLNGEYHVNFSQPLMLDYEIHIKGGSLVIYGGNAFDFVAGGGFCAESVSFRRIEPEKSTTICGSWKKHGAIKLGDFVINNCSFNGKYLLRMDFEDIDAGKTDFGFDRVSVCSSRLKNGGAVMVLNGVIAKECRFESNRYEAFPVTPIYICFNHSSKLYKNELNTYDNVEGNLLKSADVYITGNEFLGKEVSLDYYYCAALVEARRCFFRGNHLKDIINYTDAQSLSNATCYDAYLSCAEVYFEDNVIEDMMSFSRNGGSKPQCEIGKSKSNVLRAAGLKSVRVYRNNRYSVDGRRFIAEGADRASLYANIFGNVNYMDKYVWDNNEVTFVEAGLSGRTSSAGYGVFEMKDNHFRVDRISGNGLCMISSLHEMKSVDISGNVFEIKDHIPFTLFNQVYNEDYGKTRKGNISVRDNEVKGSSPLVYFFTADTVSISANRCDTVRRQKNYYVCNYTGKETRLDLGWMDVDLPLNPGKDGKFNCVHFSDKSLGRMSQRVGALSAKNSLTGTCTCEDGRDFCFDIVREGPGADTVLCTVTMGLRDGRLFCECAGETLPVDNLWTRVYAAEGILFRIRAEEGGDRLTYVLSGGSSRKPSAELKLVYYSR